MARYIHHSEFSKGMLYVAGREGIQKKDSKGEQGVPYTQVKFELKTPKHGKLVPKFEGPFTHFATGIKFQDQTKSKFPKPYPVLQGFAKFYNTPQRPDKNGDMIDNIYYEDILNFVQNIEETKQKGWIKFTDYNVEKDDMGETTKTTILEGAEVYDKSPKDPDRKVILKLDKEEIILQKIGTPELEEGASKSEKNRIWINVEFGGKEGFWDRLFDDIARVLFSIKVHPSDCTSESDVRKKLKPVIHFPKDKETGEKLEGKYPSMFMNMAYFQAREDKPEGFVPVYLPSTKKEKTTLPPEVMSKSSIWGFPIFTLVYANITDKIKLHIVCNQIAVKDIAEIVRNNLQEERLLTSSTEENELLNELERIKGLADTTVYSKEPIIGNEVKPDLNSLLDNGPVQEELKGMNFEEL